MPGMPERHSKDCKVSVGSKTTEHRREVRLDFSATDARVQCPLWVKSGHVQCTHACPLSARSGHPKSGGIEKAEALTSRLGLRVRSR